MNKTDLQNMTETEQEQMIQELQINLASNETAEEGLEEYFRECDDWYNTIEDYILDDFYNGNTMTIVADDIDDDGDFDVIISDADNDAVLVSIKPSAFMS